MSFASVSQNKSNGESGETSRLTKSSYHTNNLTMDSHDYIIHLQRTVGNQAVKRLMRSSIGFDFAKIGIQPKLKISQPGEIYEQEADRVAE
jgi:hypothetical protein